MPNYSILGKTLLIAGISLAILTIFDYVIFLGYNSGTSYVNPYEYIQYGIIALLVLAGIALIVKKKS